MEYDINKIRVLCGRYFDGDITEDEEMTLKSWFLNTEEIPSDLKTVKAMFRGFEEAAAMRYRTFGRIFWGTVAAAAAAAVCIGIFNREIYGYDADGKAITDPQVAMESTSYLSYLDTLETSIDIAMMLTMEMETTTDK